MSFCNLFNYCGCSRSQESEQEPAVWFQPDAQTVSNDAEVIPTGPVGVLDDPIVQSTITYLKHHLDCKITNESDIKSGAFGAVYFIRPGSTHHPSGAPPGQDLALKTIELTQLKEKRLAKSFRREVRIYQRLKDGDSHEQHIVSFYGAFVFGFNRATGKYEPRPFDASIKGGLTPNEAFVSYFGAMWLEKCTADLATWMEERKYEHLPEEISKQLFKQVGGALLFLHAQQPAIVHVDLKAENIGVLVNEADDTPTFKLLDFGICNDTTLNGDEFCQSEEYIFAKELKGLTWNDEEWDDTRNPSRLKDVLRSMMDESIRLREALEQLA